MLSIANATYNNHGQVCPMLNFAAFRDMPLEHAPFDHLIVPNFICDTALDDINESFPLIEHPGSFPISALKIGGAFENFVDQLRGKEFEQAIGNKFSIDLSNQPNMLTVRGQCRAQDGKIHRDSGGKIITVLVYLNGHWDRSGGQLRLLHSKNDIEDYSVTVPPVAGTLLAFRCSDNAWHGHKSYEGERRSMQLNWVSGHTYLWREALRHNLSAMLKNFSGRNSAGNK